MMSIYFHGSIFSITCILIPLFKETRETPYKTVYPFEYSSSPKFEIMYLMQSFINFYVILGVIIGVDCLFMAACYNIIAQFRLLKGVVLKLGTNEVKEINSKLTILSSESDNIGRNVTKEKEFLIRCIKHHQLLLRTTEDIETVYSVIGLFQLGFSIIAICMSSFVVTTGEIEYVQLVNISIFISGHIVQLFCYCSVANEIGFEMDNLSQHIFSSYWYQTDFVNIKQDILVIMKKSQEVKRITALKLVPLNYDTFIQVLRISFSFHTLLSNITVK
uniref:Odorant receptor n=1 Tax=Anoplophora chinensis TaxID=217632 RepID=A0A2H4ZBB2_ANOCN|nr:odorant receptor [Anoplophora chinensis]